MLTGASWVAYLVWPCVMAACAMYRLNRARGASNERPKSASGEEPWGEYVAVVVGVCGVTVLLYLAASTALDGQEPEIYARGSDGFAFAFANGMLIGAILGVPIVSETAMPKNVVAFSMIASFGLLMAMLGGAAWNWSIGVDGNGIRRSEFWQLGADARPLTDVVEIIGFDSRGGVIGNARKSPHTVLRMADGTTWDTFDLLSGRERELGDVLERILPEARRSSKYLHRVDFMGRTIDVVDTLP